MKSINEGALTNAVCTLSAANLLNLRKVVKKCAADLGLSVGAVLESPTSEIAGFQEANVVAWVTSVAPPVKGDSMAVKAAKNKQLSLLAKVYSTLERRFGPLPEAEDVATVLR